MARKLYYWVANWNLSHAQASLLLRGEVADMIDVTHSSLTNALKAYPTVERFAGYVTGSPDIRWTPDDWKRIPGACAIRRIDQSNQDLPMLSDVKRVVADQETGAKTVAETVKVAHERLSMGDDYTIYCDQAELDVVEHAIGEAGLPHGQIVAYQWASPSSNPNTRVPGTSLTLKEANVDLSVVSTSYMPLPQHHVVAGHPSPSHRHSLARAHIQGGTGDVQLDLRDMNWSVIHGDVTVRPLPWGD